MGVIQTALDGPRYAEQLILTAMTIWLTMYGLIATITLWARRPAIGLDPDTGRYRAARAIAKDRAR